MDPEPTPMEDADEGEVGEPVCIFFWGGAVWICSGQFWDAYITLQFGWSSESISVHYEWL